MPFIFFYVTINKKWWNNMSKKPASSFSECLALETRIVFDAAIGATAADVADQAYDAASETADTSSAEAQDIAITPQNDQKTEIVFIDPRVPDAALLAENVRDDVQVIWLDPAQNGMTQIGEALQQIGNVDAVHIITHAENDGLRLGASLVTAETINDQADAFQGWQSALSANADILFYGCDLAKDANGQDILNKIAEYTGADIAASDDLTGDADLGGDWDLEFSNGVIETQIAITQNGMASYNHVLVATPVATISGLDDPLLGETFEFTVSFDNTDALDTGFTPYIDLYMPFTGADGVYDPIGNSYTATPDGITFVSATYLGQAVDVTTVTIEDGDLGTPGIQFEHPLAVDAAGDPVVMTLDAGLFKNGDQLHVLSLPFGSFTPDQPIADITVTATMSNLADLSTPLNISANAGFVLGGDALNNPAADPSIIQATTINTSTTVTPQLYRMTSSFSGPEGETATGENFERDYNVTIEVAAGHQLDNVTLDFILPEETYYVSTTAAGGVIGAAPLQDTAGDTADDTISVTYANITGSQTTSYRFYVGETDQAGTNVLDPNTGAAVTIQRANNVVLNADWTPVDARDGAAQPISQTDTAVAFDAKSIAIQKSVSVQNDTGTAGATPGDTLEYTLNFQVSDYFAFDNITITDDFSDGMLMNGFTPVLDITRQGVSNNGLTFTLGGNYTDTANPDGSHQLSFDVSALMLATPAISSGVLEGGHFDTDTLSGTTGSVTFRTDIQDQYVNVPAGNTFVKQGDTLTNNVDIQGRLLDTSFTPIGPNVSDLSSADISVAVGELTISPYALNGVAAPFTQVKPGDTVTFRMQYDLVTGDFDNFNINAFVPLPIFDVTELVGGFVGGTPGAGQFAWGPNNEAEITAAVVSPTATVDGTSNFINFDLGDFDDVDNDGGQIDILFTLTVTDDPFADGLFLTTLGQGAEDNTPGTTAFDPDLGQIELTEPVIDGIVKGVIATNAVPAATYTANPDSRFKDAGNTDAAPFTGTINSTNLAAQNMDSDLSNVDAGDMVRFALVIENTGSSANGAFDVQLSDVIPAGFAVPAGGINMRVVDGTGSSVAFTYVDGGAGTDQAALFGSGIELTDGATGAVGAYDAANGQNIVIVTYDLEAITTIEAGTVTNSDATLFNYAGIEGGDDHTTTDLTDAAQVTIAGADVVKTIIGTDRAFTTGNNATIGEIVTYQVVITVPEGNSTAVTLTDTLDQGLAFVGIDSIVTSSGDLTTDIAGGFPGVLAGATFQDTSGAAQDAARRLVLDFGDITNANTDNSTAETITITYRAIVANAPAAQDGIQRNNAATWAANNDSDTGNAPNLTIQEPDVDLTLTPDVSNADAGDTVTWTLTVSAPAGIDTDVFDIDLSNVIPSGLTYVGASLSNTGGVAPDTLGEAGGTISATWATLDAGETSTLQFQTTIDTGVSFGQNLTNSPVVTWSSLPGIGTNTDLEGAGSLTTLDAERTGNTGDDGGTANDYRNTINSSVQIQFATPVLSIVDTSEATNGGDATLGEIVRYRIQIQVPESTTSDFRIRPNLPTGLQFLDDGTATLGFVSDGAGITSSTLAGAGLDIAGDEGSVAGVSPTFVLPGGAILGGPFNSGTDPVFAIGNITNGNSDVNQEFIVVEFNALVTNTAGVDTGDTLNVDATLFSGVTSLISTNDVDLDIVEPILGNLDKSVTDTDGTTATYQITFNNTSGQTAFDVNLADSIPANLTNLSISSITPAGGVAGVTDNTAGSNIDIDISTFPSGGSITVIYTADIVDPALVVADTDATVTWTGIDGAAASLSGSTAGATGTATGERDGSGGTNDYSISDGAGLNTLTGTVWEDLNLDGTVDGGEVRMNNIQVNLLWAGNDGIFGNGDDIAMNTLSDASGNYSFGALPSGDFRISLQPSGVNGIPVTHGSVWDSEGSLTDNLTNLTLGEGVAQANVNFGLQPANTAPSFGSLGGASVTPDPNDTDVSFTEDGSAVVLDADATIADTELDAIDDYDGAILTLNREGGANAEDVFGNTGTLGALTQGGNLTIGGTTIGTVTTNTGGTLVLTFNGNATAAHVDSVIQQITYENTSNTPPTSVTIAYDINDGNTAGDQGSGGVLNDPTGRVVIGITSTNDLPTGADRTVTHDEDTTYTFSASDFGYNDLDGNIADPFTNLRIDTIPAPGDGVLALNGVPVIAGDIIPVGQIGLLTFTPDAHESGNNYNSFTFSVQDSSGGFDPVPNTMTINVNPISDAPPVTAEDVSGPPGDNIPLTITTMLVDTDGSETLDPNITLSNIPVGMSLFGPGGVPIAVVGGTATIPVADLGDISIETLPTMRGQFTLSVTSISTDAPDAPAPTVEPFTVTLADPFGPPVPPSDPPAPIPGNGPTPPPPEGDPVPPGGDIPPGFIDLSDYQDRSQDITRTRLYLAGTIDDRLMIVNEEMTVNVNKDVFRHTDPSEKLTYEAVSADGGALPDWLEFDAEKLSFSGTPPEDAPKNLEITIIAKDGNGDEVQATFRIKVNRDVAEVETPESQEEQGQEDQNKDNNNDQTGLILPPSIAFADQLLEAGRMGQIQADTAFIDQLNQLNS